ncbi:MAG: helix-turn-helix domain-containing protein [Candidatus Bathyarchaeia archaeon]
MSSLDSDRLKLESELRGTTLRVYWQLFTRNKSTGVRELQRAMGLSSPSTALYHLEKLRRLGLIEKTPEGEYVLAEMVKVGVLRQFIRFGRLMLPRYLFYAAFFWTALIFYLAKSLISGLQPELMVVTLTSCAAAATTYEAARTWRERLF